MSRAPLELIVGEARYRATLARSFCGFTLSMGVLALALIAGLDVDPSGYLLALLALFVALGIATGLFGSGWPPTAIVIFTVFAAGVVLFALAEFGRDYESFAAIIPPAVAACFLFYSRLQAALVGAILIAGYAVVLNYSNFAEAAEPWLIVTGMTLSFSGVSAWIAAQLQGLADAERAAAAEVERLAGELAGANERLRRYVAPQVAAASAVDDATALAPHRRRIAVVFVDLRGFTRFTAGAEPEDVVELLGAYYATVGAVAHAHGATLGSYAGDGVMAYVGDADDAPDPPGAALDLAFALAAPI
ncbi:MAG: hypothetical protein H0W25_00750 [Acidimicrobiia bacterium]|nr:hypothetical protein [Acidimicrobiia bacterium]